MNIRGYDIVGDIHGHADELEALLQSMGYQQQGAGYVHPSRILIMVGDLIDRGPKQKRVLEIAQGMVSHENAIVLMGNHEFNAICYATVKEGDYVRAHSASNANQHKAFLAEFPFQSTAYWNAIGFFKTLPLWFESEQFGVVHAYWDEESMDRLDPFLQEDRSIKNFDLISQYGDKASREYDSLELILKGPELTLPVGISFIDKGGTVRTEVRVNWWKLAEKKSEHLAFDASSFEPSKLDGLYIAAKEYSYKGRKVVFFGHYWQKNFDARSHVDKNLFCLDYSIAMGGQLVAARWNGPVDAIEWFAI